MISLMHEFVNEYIYIYIFIYNKINYISMIIVIISINNNITRSIIYR